MLHQSVVDDGMRLDLFIASFPDMDGRTKGIGVKDKGTPHYSLAFLLLRY